MVLMNQKYFTSTSRSSKSLRLTPVYTNSQQDLVGQGIAYMRGIGLSRATRGTGMVPYCYNHPTFRILFSQNHHNLLVALARSTKKQHDIIRVEWNYGTYTAFPVRWLAWHYAIPLTTKKKLGNHTFSKICSRLFVRALMFLR